jgi:hypothetical protein
MGFLSWLTRDSDPASIAAREESAKRQEEIVQALRADRVPPSVVRRLQDAASAKRPWIATLTPAELMIARSYGFRPIATVSATCWMSVPEDTSGWMASPANPHFHGWTTALSRLRAEAKAAGANAVIDVKMRSVSIGARDNMDFTLVGTAVKVEGLPPSDEPIIATLPALELIKLLQADIVPTGIVIGAHDVSIPDPRKNKLKILWRENVEYVELSDLMTTARKMANTQMRTNAFEKGRVVLALAHVQFSRILKLEGEGLGPSAYADRARGHVGARYAARHVAIATTIDQGSKKSREDAMKAHSGTVPSHGFTMVVDMHAGKTPLANTTSHHQSYRMNDEEGGA